MALEEESFQNLNLSMDILRGIYTYGFKNPSKVQLDGIVKIQSKKDCIIQSQSGTGKTATYLIGVLSNIDNNNNNVQSIILAPTRELSIQIHQVAKNLSKFTNVNPTLCVAGEATWSIKKSILGGSKLLIGTTGRINHLLTMDFFKMEHFKILIIDEADNLLSYGFKDSVFEIFKKIPEEIQMILVSATFPKDVHFLMNKFMIDPEKILLRKTELIVEKIKQYYIDVEEEEHKYEILLDLFAILDSSKTIIYTNSIRKLEWLQDKLCKENYPIAFIHGKMERDERNKIIEQFKNNEKRILLTTDLLARGIDIKNVNLVINYDLPKNFQNYIHRIGRSGRFGADGVAINFVKLNDDFELKNFHKLQQFFEITINELPENIKNLV